MAVTQEIETLAQFDEHLSRSTALTGMVLQSVDLTDRDEALAAADPTGAVFLGCTFSPAGFQSVRERGGIVFPTVPDVPVNPYRAGLYSPDELFDTLPGGTYADSLDGRVYAWTQAEVVPPKLSHTFVTSLHDHAISDALLDRLADVDPGSIVGIMGGHAMQRGEPAYREAVELGARLGASGRLVVTGGGPGAMEAANLGACLSAHSATDRDEACRLLAATPSFRPSIDAWAKAAFDVRSAYAPGAPSLGIPTWFYGHEPPNAFATDIAKYFSNALREDILLTLCRGGIIYLPGAAGTVQELFQAVTGNYYATDPATIVPLVLVGREQWTTRLPVWPLLERLADGRQMAHRIHLVDAVDEAWQHLA